MSESNSMKAQQAGEGVALALDAFLPYRAARLATALSRALAAQYEQRYDISVAEWRVLVHLTQQTEISVRDIFTRVCLLYTSPSPRDKRQSRMPSSA